jgi:hypothetical protein
MVKLTARAADESVVSDETGLRCPRCGAFARAESQWCTLCYADLRPAPEPVAVAVPVGAAGSATADIDPLTAPLDVVVRGRHAAPLADPSGEAAGSTPDKGWPCASCDTVVSFDDSVCPTCGTGFLDGARGEPDLVQRLGSKGLATSTQWLIILGGSFGIIALLIGALYVIGAIF